MAIKKYNFANGWPIKIDALHEAVFGKYGDRVNDDTFKDKNHEDVLASHGLELIEIIRSGPCIFYANRACIKINKHNPQVTVHYKEEPDSALESLEKFTNSKLVEIAKNG